MVQCCKDEKVVVSVFDVGSSAIATRLVVEDANGVVLYRSDTVDVEEGKMNSCMNRLLQS